jgi:LysR family glycine cleavage system transcriptional activator
MSLTETQHRVPPLTALRAFEAAARHMSFAKAAEELFVTRAALSYQIKQLETHFGVPLFHRLNRAVELTEAGRTLLPGVAEGFGALRAAARAVMRLTEKRALTITAGPAFTAKWLAPRFFRFAAAHPEIELRFIASLRILDFDRDGIDAAIRYSARDAKGEYTEVLANDWLTPLCAPDLAAELKTPDDLADKPLLHDDSLAYLDSPPGWPTWLRHAGCDSVDGMRGVRFTHADHVLDAAIEGAGVALGRLYLAERDIAAGRLVAPFPLAVGLPSSYRFVCPEGAENAPVIRTFLDWIREETLGAEGLVKRFRLAPAA